MDFQKFKKEYQKREPEEYNIKVTINPLVSICVQTYQHANFIRDCLDGILMQKTNFSFEVLLGEDQSADGTREICKEYAEKYPQKIRLFLHRRENNIKIKGKPTGRFNLVYNLFSARGKYIALLDGDDYWTDHLKLQKQVDFLESNTDYIIHAGNAKYLSDKQSINQKTMYGPGDEKFGLHDFIGKNNLATCTVLFRNTHLSFPDSFTKYIYGDWFLYLLLLKESGKLALRSGEVFAVYREHEGGITKNLGLKRECINHTSQIKNNLNYTTDCTSISNGKKKINDYCIATYRAYVQGGLYKSAMQVALLNLKLTGFSIPLKKYIRELRF